MSTTNILDLNNRIDGLNASNIKMSDGVTSVEEAVENMGNMRMAKLWENPSPTSSFAGQSITLSSNDYDMLLVLGRYRNDNNALCPSAIGKDGYIIFPDYESEKSLPTYRRFTASSTTVSFGNCARNGTVNNNYLIPYQIYGIKLT